MIDADDDNDVTIMTRAVSSCTEFLHAAVGEDAGLRWVQSTTSQEVSNFESIDETVTTVPEVEQVEHFFHVCSNITLTAVSAVE